MISFLKKILVNFLTGANMVTAGLLLISGFSDRVNPESHPIIACAGMAFPVFLLINLTFVVFWVFFCWKRLWVPLLGFALAYVPIHIYIPLHFQAEAPTEGLTIVSWNVCGYGGNYKYEHEQAFDSIFHYALSQQADIVCLQEDMNYAPAMKRYGAFYPYNDTTKVSEPEHKLVNALGIHSKYPILRKEKIDYQSLVNGSVAYYLLVGSDTVLIINNHLESTHLSDKDRHRYKDMLHGSMSGDTARAETMFLIERLGESMAQRAPHVRAIHDYIAQHRQYPIIVCGDFNDTPISYARHTVAKGLTDCFVEAGCGLGLSFNQKGFNFRIDHMMVSDHFIPADCKIDAEIDVSDHYPVVCRLKKADKP